jgi:hypothetical protein
MNSARQRAQLVEPRDELAIRLRKQLLGAGVEADAGTRETQLETDREQPLLRAVVQVALQPPPLSVPGRHDPRP